MMEQFMKSGTNNKDKQKQQAIRDKGVLQKNEYKIEPKYTHTVPQIRQLRQLQNDILKERPNNINDYIRRWAIMRMSVTNAAMGAYSLYSLNYADTNSDEEFIEVRPTTKRRNACCENISSLSNNKICHDINTVKKTEETKSKILIVLRNMVILDRLSSENLWMLTEQCQIFSLNPEKCILKKKQILQNIIIVLTGTIQLNLQVVGRHNKIYTEGSCIGEQTLVFSTICQGNYIAKNNSSQQKQNCKIAVLSSSRIKQMIRRVNQQYYETINNAIRRIQALRNYNAEQRQKIINVVLNSAIYQYQSGQNATILSSSTDKTINAIKTDNYNAVQSFFIVIEGCFGEYYQDLMSIHLKSSDSNTKYKQRDVVPHRIYRVCDTIGAQRLSSIMMSSGSRITGYEDKTASSRGAYSRTRNRLVQVKMGELERVVRPIKMLNKMKKI